MIVRHGSAGEAQDTWQSRLPSVPEVVRESYRKAEERSWPDALRSRVQGGVRNKAFAPPGRPPGTPLNGMAAAGGPPFLVSSGMLCIVQSGGCWCCAWMPVLRLDKAPGMNTGSLYATWAVHGLHRQQLLGAVVCCLLSEYLYCSDEVPLEM